MKFQDLRYPEDIFSLRYNKSQVQIKNLKNNDRIYLRKKDNGKDNEYILALLDIEDLSSVEESTSVIFEVSASNIENEKLESYLRSFSTNVFLIRKIDKSGKGDFGEIYIARLGFNSRDLDMKFLINKNTVKHEKKDSEEIRKEIVANFLIEDFKGKSALLGVKKGSNEENKNKSNEPDVIIKGKKGYGFYILKRQKLLGENYSYVVDKKVNNILEEKYEFYLALNVDVTDDTDEGKIRKQQAEMLEKNNSVYLNEWIKYGEKEEERTYEGFKRAGILTFKDSENIENNLVKFIIDDGGDSHYNVEEAIEKFAVEAGEFENIDLLRTVEFKTGDDFDPVEYKKTRNKMNPTEFTYYSANSKSRTVTLKRTEKSLKSSIPKEGKLLLNIIGDCTRYERRKKAIERLKDGNMGIPHLLLLIEGEELQGRVEPKKVTPLSAEIRERCFPHGPTQNQLDAIEMALATPDVALIQGPPGTGKTTVISAIQARLEEEFRGDPTDKVVVLVTSDQHEAVSNAIKKMETNGSPVQKFGGRFKDDDKNKQNLDFNQWLDKLKKDILERHPGLIKSMDTKEYEDLYEHFIKGSNSIQTTLNILEKVKDIFVENRVFDLQEECMFLIMELKMMSGENRIPDYIMRSIKNIPTSNEQFEDGGAKELIFLSDIFKIEKQKNLQKLGETLGEMGKKKKLEAKDMARLKIIKEKLILKYTPTNPLFIDRKKYAAVENLLERGLLELQKNKMQNADADEQVVLEFYTELERNPLFIQNEFRKYQISVGATCQQAASGNISNVKGEKVTINNVIIDEAARANPLDIIIPASMAKEKVIFVGDQNQLPHIVEKEILDRIQNSDETVESIENRKALLEQSMFGRLYTALKKSEQRDKIKRVITLDKQFRMHRVLGDFVSENFYKDKVGGIESPREPEEFQHSIPGIENKACVWIDVPYSKGGELKGMSKTRPVEAQQIAKHLKSIIDLPQTQDLTFGIITFYKDQVAEIRTALEKYGISKDENKLLVGTVDAFQGKEFDVVYLSVVRSNKAEKTNAKYGYLTVENRLCVSMSRQKKLLIVVGDAQMFTVDIEEKPKALENFYNMCKENKEYGKVLDYLE